jgi:hypothetical protein
MSMAGTNIYGLMLSKMPRIKQFMLTSKDPMITTSSNHHTTTLQQKNTFHKNVSSQLGMVITQEGGHNCVNKAP